MGHVLTEARGTATVVVAAHAAAFAAIYVAAVAIRFDGSVPAALWDSIERTLLALVLLKTGVFVAMGCHRSRGSSATFADLTGLAEAALLGSVLAAPWLLIGAAPPIPRSVIVIDWIGATLGLCGARLAGRLLRERYGPMLSSSRLRRVVVVGAGPAGEAMVRGIGAQPQLGLKVVGLLDDDPALAGRVRAGVPVLGSPRELARIAAGHRLDLALHPHAGDAERPSPRVG